MTEPQSHQSDRNEGTAGRCVSHQATLSLLVRGKNINETTLLATDYLNHFNEIIMVLELVPDMPECLEEAQTQLGAALETFTSLQVPFEEGRTRLELARLAHAREDAETATRELAEAHAVFSRLGVPVYVERTRTLEGELETTPRST